MIVDELADLRLEPEVVALGRPDRVFKPVPLFVPATRWLLTGLGVLLLAGAGAGVMWFVTSAPARFRADNAAWAVAIGGAAIAALIGLGLATLGSKLNEPTSVYALYPEAMAFAWDGAWTVVRWDEIRSVLDPGLGSLYARLQLKDGRQIPLRNHFFHPTALYGEVRHRVLHPGSSRGVSPVESGWGAATSGWEAARAGRPLPTGRFEGVPAVPRAVARKRAVGQMVTGGIAIVLALIVLMVNLRWVSSAIAGPVPMTLAQLRDVKSAGDLPNPWIRLPIDRAIETGLVMTTSRNGGEARPRSRYLLIQVGDRWLIADVPHDFSGREVVGYLGVWWTPLSLKVIEAVKQKAPEQRDRLLPYQINAEYAYRGQCLAMVAMVAVGLVIGPGLILSGLALSRRASEPGVANRSAMLREPF